MAEEKKSDINFWKRLGYALSLGAMGMGQGMTQAPYLSNWLQLQQRQAESEEEKKFRQWQMEQKGAENQMAMLKQGYLPSKRPISTVPSGMYTEMGGQGYRFTPQIAQYKKNMKSYEYTPAFRENLQKTINELLKGKTEEQKLYMYQALVAEYPEYSNEIKRLFYPTATADAFDTFMEELIKKVK